MYNIYILKVYLKSLLHVVQVHVLVPLWLLTCRSNSVRFEKPVLHNAHMYGRLEINTSSFFPVLPYSVEVLGSIPAVGTIRVQSEYILICS